MKHYVKVRIKTSNKTKLILKLNQLSVDLKNIKYEKDCLIFDILNEDLSKLKKYLISYKVEILDETGIYKIKKELKHNRLFLISLVFGCLVFLFLSNIIVKVNIIHESRELRELIETDLEEYGVTALSFKKSYEEYERIIAKIKENHKEEIEWLEIDVDGMVINIRVEERIINDYEKETGYCHIVASKSGIIRNILTQKGVSLVNPNDFVVQDQILISGEVKLNEEIKNDVCAQGNVYAEVWYNVQAKIPLNYVEEKKTGKMRYNFMIKNMEETVLLKSRIKEKQVENIFLFKLFGYEFYLQKEYEIVKKSKTYTEKEALDKGINLIHQKLETQGAKIANIINEKVLKKNVNNDNLDIDMFLALEEQIGIKKVYVKEMGENGYDEDRSDNH